MVVEPGPLGVGSGKLPGAFAGQLLWYGLGKKESVRDTMPLAGVFRIKSFELAGMEVAVPTVSSRWL